jgi:hypothetical protein
MSHEPFESQLLPFQALRLNSRHFFPPPPLLLFVGFAPCCAFSFASSHLALETRASGEGPSGVEYTEDGPRTERTRALMVYDTPTFDLSFGIMISREPRVATVACTSRFFFCSAFALSRKRFSIAKLQVMAMARRDCIKN